jgi:hypothetical protein
MKTRRFLLIALCAFIAALSLTFGVRRFAAFGPLAGHIVPAAPQISPLIRSLRPSYPYSVIPGGAYSPAELHYANQTDAVVRAHYATFNMKLAHIVRLTDDRFQYASYRIKDQIYWTRCGNRLSEAPQAPVSPREPAVALLSMPPIRPEMLPALELAQSPPLGEVAEASPRLAPILPNSSEAIPVADLAPLPAPILPLPPTFPYVPPLVRHQPPPTFNVTPPITQISPILPVPEPSTVGLFLITFCVSLWAMTRVLPAGKPAAEQPEHPVE